MASNVSMLLRTSVFRKQLIALTGLAMVGFVIAHLSGNLLIFLGPEMFNHYADMLHHLPEIVWPMRIGLLAAIIIHIVLTIQLVRENKAARPRAYEVEQVKGDKKFATTAMIYTGLLLVFFIVLHLIDFTFANREGELSYVDGESLSLFGLVWNKFSLEHGGWWRVPVYIAAMISLGLHLSHAIQSVFQTLGANNTRYMPHIKKLSLALGILIAFAFASIPIYVLIMPEPMGA